MAEAQKRILIVEDDVFISDLYVKVFSDAGFVVDTAIDGEKALDLLGNNIYNMILLDIMIPKISGIEVLEKIKDPNHPAKAIPVFVTTNLGQEDVMERAHNLGANGYIIKSQLTPHQVSDKVVEFLGKLTNTPQI